METNVDRQWREAYGRFNNGKNGAGELLSEDLK
jgi:hypothetical protein